MEVHFIVLSIYLSNIPNHSIPQRVHIYNPLSASRREQLQSDYSNLECIVIDEISMVSDNIFHFVHQRLEEIKNHKVAYPVYLETVLL